MPRNTESESRNSPESRLAPEPEGPEEVYRKFERMNRRGGDKGLRDLIGGSGKNVLYGAFAVVEVAAILLALFFDVPFMDIVAFVLPGLLIMFHNGSKTGEQVELEGESEAETSEVPDQESKYDSGYGSQETPNVEPEGAREEESVLETLLRRFGVEIPEDEPRSGGR